MSFLFIFYPVFYVNGIEVLLQLKKRSVPNAGHLMESQLLVFGNTVVYKKNRNGKLQAKLEVVQTIQRENEIIDYQKFQLKSEERVVITEEIPHMVDVRNFSLNDGKYLFKVDIIDLNSSVLNAISLEDSIEFNSVNNIVYFSDIQLFNDVKKSSVKTRFTKSGYDLIPKFGNYFTLNDHELSFYFEIYNLSKIQPREEEFLLRIFLKNEMGKTVDQASKFRKIKSSDIVPILENLTLRNLPFGSYNLHLIIKNRNNNTVGELVNKIEILNYPNNENLSKNFPFEKINDDSLFYFVETLVPLSGTKEREIINGITLNDSLTSIKGFLAEFWIKRFPEEPFEHWMAHKRRVEKCNELFGTSVKKGFETDQGYVYLKYGSPNSVSKRDKEPNAYPYEIWHYYKIGSYNNKRFIFYNPNLNLNDYVLLHSEVPGEIKDSKWQLRIQNRTNPKDNIDKIKGVNSYGGQIDELNNLPR